VNPKGVHRSENLAGSACFLNSRENMLMAFFCKSIIYSAK